MSRKCVEALQIVGDGYEAENVPFTFSLKEGGEELRLAPYHLWKKMIMKFLFASSGVVAPSLNSASLPSLSPFSTF